MAEADTEALAEAVALAEAEALAVAVALAAAESPPPSGAATIMITTPAMVPSNTPATPVAATVVPE